jgi:acyl-CoA dehydrogenase
MMEFRLSSEQELFGRTLREWCQANIEPRAQAIDREEQGIPDDIISGLAELGVLGITIPEQYGGSMVPGQAFSLANIAVQEIARADLSMSVPVYTLLCIGWPYLITRYGTEELKREVLPKVASGEYFVGIATTEAGGGSDVANIQTRARLEDDRLVLNGEKTYISGIRETTEQRDGGHLTLVRTDPEAGHRGFSFVYVPARNEGVAPHLYEDIGRGGLSTGGFRYKDARVPKRNLIGELNRGFYMNMEGFDVARSLVSAACVGAALRALEMSKEYVKQRMAFGRPIAKFEGVSFEIAEDESRLSQLGLWLRYACWMLDRFYAEPGSFTYHDLSHAISICKMEAPHLALEIVKHSMMYFGAFSFTTESPLGMALRGLMSYVVGAEGATNIQKLIIAREVIGPEAIPYR